MKRFGLFLLAMMMTISLQAQNSNKEWGIQLYTLRTMIGTPDLYRKNRHKQPSLAKRTTKRSVFL